jgi:hypothetical protein
VVLEGEHLAPGIVLPVAEEGRVVLAEVAEGVLVELAVDLVGEGPELEIALLLLPLA